MRGPRHRVPVQQQVCRETGAKEQGHGRSGEAARREAQGRVMKEPLKESEPNRFGGKGEQGGGLGGKGGVQSELGL